jgi:hypothetical protein
MTKLNKLGFNWSNHEKRKAWLEKYQDWGMYCETKEFAMKWYKFDLPNGKRIVVCEYPSSYRKGGVAAEYYCLRNAGAILMPKYPCGINSAADILKDINKEQRQ